jgi:hypothetical protein
MNLTSFLIKDILWIVLTFVESVSFSDIFKKSLIKSVNSGGLKLKEY